MLLAGLSEKEIRKELDSFLSFQKQSGGVGERGKKTYGMAIAILASWFSPDSELMIFRDAALAFARKLPSKQWLPLHWAVVSSAYPFWFNVAKQTGRLLNLQDQVSQSQIFGRLKEEYGDRETVTRNARYAVRSFIAWGVLQDADTKGCYKKNTPIIIDDPILAILLLESALLATPEAKSALSLLLNNPAFFPFQLPVMTGDFVSQHNDRIDVIYHGLDDKLLKIRNPISG